MLVFFFNDTATTEIYTLSLHDALPIFDLVAVKDLASPEVNAHLLKYDSTLGALDEEVKVVDDSISVGRSEEHTSELQSRQYLVCRLLLEKKKKTQTQALNDSSYKSNIY